MTPQQSHIISIICDNYSIVRKRLFSKFRTYEIVEARQITHYQLSFHMSRVDLALMFDLNESSIYYSINMVKNKIAKSPEFALEMIELKEQIESVINKAA